VLSLTLRTLRLILMIWNFSFFIGMGWLLLCVSLEEYKQRKNYLEIMDQSHLEFEPDFTFIDDYQLHFQTAYEQMVIAVYFAFTSLSTVGFGDYCPRSDLERLLGSIMLLFGVSIFSMAMGRFIEMVEQIKQFNQSLDEGDQLSRFFGVIERFNHGKPINMELKRDIEEHFNYKWNYDRNMAL